jgi:hypothetical protein
MLPINLLCGIRNLHHLDTNVLRTAIAKAAHRLDLGGKRPSGAELQPMPMGHVPVASPITVLPDPLAVQRAVQRALKQPLNAAGC